MCHAIPVIHCYHCCTSWVPRLSRLWAAAAAETKPYTLKLHRNLSARSLCTYRGASLLLMSWLWRPKLWPCDRRLLQLTQPFLKLPRRLPGRSWGPGPGRPGRPRRSTAKLQNRVHPSQQEEGLRQAWQAKGAVRLLCYAVLRRRSRCDACRILHNSSLKPRRWIGDEHTVGGVIQVASGRHEHQPEPCDILRPMSLEKPQPEL